MPLLSQISDARKLPDTYAILALHSKRKYLPPPETYSDRLGHPFAPQLPPIVPAFSTFLTPLANCTQY